MTASVRATPRRLPPGPRLALVRRLAWVPVGTLAVLLTAAIAAPPVAAFDQPWLLTALNLVLLTILPLAAAVIAVRAYRRTGVGAVLAVGAGLLATALGGGVLPPLLSLSAGPNALITIHNGAALLAALCHVAGALGGVAGVTLGRRRRLHVALAYGLVTGAVAALVAAFATGMLPVFWADGVATEARQFTLGWAVGLTTLSAFLWWEVAVRDREIRFLVWYVPGLALVALGLVGVMTQAEPGGLRSWLGRAGQYGGAIYLLLAVWPESRPRRGRDDPGVLGVALLQAALPLRPLVESATDAVIAVGRTGRVVYWNGAAADLFGTTAADAFDGDPVDLLLAPDAREADRAALRALLAVPSAGAGAGPLLLVLAGRDGRPVPAELTALASPGDDRLLVCVIRDVTERVRAQEELENRVRERTAALRQANEDLERANRAKDEFLGLVSHELRTPITTIVAAGSLLQRRLGEADRDGLAADVIADATRLAGIVDNLLALARLDRSGAPDPEPIAFDRLAASVVAAARRANPERTIDLDAAPGVIVEGADSQLAMAVGNLVSNALKYSPADTPVEVSLASDGRTARLAVRDRGPGIDPDEAASLFEPFYRSATLNGVAGVGIGLTVCRRIVDAMGGSVAARPRADGPGAEFTITLPVPATPDDEPEDARPADAAAPLP